MLGQMKTTGVVLFALLMTGSGVLAQTASDWNANKFQATRAELQSKLVNFEKAAHDGGYTEKIRAQARFEANVIKQRLEMGDYQPGDQVVLLVEGEPTLSDSLTVSPELTLSLKSGDTISLKGVLRSELEDRFKETIRRVVRNPKVHTESFMRIAVLGDVGKQGYYVVRAESQLSEVLMAAGGPGGAANLMSMRIERGTKAIWDGEPLQDAITEGRTLDQLSLRAGDRLVLPVQAQKTGGGGGIMGSLKAVRGFLIAIPLILAGFRALK
jgi:protein involved in polysaccharide export with SLBB domain